MIKRQVVVKMIFSEAGEQWRVRDGPVRAGGREWSDHSPGSASPDSGEAREGEAREPDKTWNILFRGKLETWIWVLTARPRQNPNQKM